jgi:hypothetical protein
MDVTKRIRVEVVTSGINGLKSIEQRLNAAQSAWERLGDDLGQLVTPHINPKPLGDLREEIDATAESWFTFKQSLESGLALPSFDPGSMSMPSGSNGGSGGASKASPNIVMEFPDLLDVRLDAVSIGAMQNAIYRGTVKARPSTISKLVTGGLEAAGASLFKASGAQERLEVFTERLTKKFAITSEELQGLKISAGVFINTLKRFDLKTAGKAFNKANEVQGLDRTNNATLGVIQDTVSYLTKLSKIKTPIDGLIKLAELQQLTNEKPGPNDTKDQAETKQRKRTNAVKDAFPDRFQQIKAKLTTAQNTSDLLAPITVALEDLVKAGTATAKQKETFEKAKKIHSGRKAPEGTPIKAALFEAEVPEVVEQVKREKGVRKPTDKAVAQQLMLTLPDDLKREASVLGDAIFDP